jgi:hypothetical protein
VFLLYIVKPVGSAGLGSALEAAEVGDDSDQDLLGGIFGRCRRSNGSASPRSPTLRRSLMRCHLLPHLGHVPVTKLTAADIDDVYAYLLRRGGRDDRPLSPGTVHRVHVVLHRALTQAVRWEWIWSNPAALASPRVSNRPRSGHRRSSRSATSLTSWATTILISSPISTWR